MKVLYAKAKTLADECRQVQGQLDTASQGMPELPDTAAIARRADGELANLDRLLESGSLKEKRELVRAYVHGTLSRPIPPTPPRKKAGRRRPLSHTAPTATALSLPSQAAFTSGYTRRGSHRCLLLQPPTGPHFLPLLPAQLLAPLHFALV